MEECISFGGGGAPGGDGDGRIHTGKGNFNITDGETYLVTLNSGVLLYQAGVQDSQADASLTLHRMAMFSILTRDEEQQKQSIKIDGDQEILKKLTEHMAVYEFFFNIVEP